MNTTKELNLDEIRQIQLEILKEFDKICRDNHIEYSLAYGTLIGAVRHGGYIPWDDDLDVMMRRKDYERILKLLKKDKNINVLNSSNAFFHWTKICAPNTYVVETDDFRIKNYGVWFDIFPIDHLPKEGTFKAKVYKSTYSLLKKMSQYRALAFNHNKTMKGVKRIAFIGLKVILSPFKITTFGRLLDKYAQIFNKKETGFSGNITFSFHKTQSMESSIFEKYQDIVFENFKARTIADYDTFLRNIYGNYMELPPVEKRVTNHSYKAYRK